MTVGGAQRNDRKRQKKQVAAARAVAAARGTKRDLTKIIVGVVVVLVVAGAVLGGVFYEQHRAQQAAETVIPALTVPGSSKYPVQLDKANATVLVGKPTAKVTIDLYEDFLCPICGEFESTYFPSIEKQLEAGTVKVRYHIIDLLDQSSVPPGYSLMSANTALAVAAVAPNKFMDFHDSLYSKQPQENGAGWTQAQLVNLANRLGVSGPAFDNLVNNKTFEAQIQKNLTTAENDPALEQTGPDGSKSFGTPTVVSGGKLVNWSQDAGWLSTLVKTAYPS